MKSYILLIASRNLRWFFIIVSIIVFFRGHNAPGGGFIGGLIAACAVIFDSLATDVKIIKKYIPVTPEFLIGSGLTLALLSILPGIISQKEFFKGIWLKFVLPVAGEIKIGTPLLFDLGVYFTVLGVVILLLFTLMEEWKWKF